MGKKFHINFRIKVMYISIIILFICVFFLMNYSFKRSRSLLIKQEAGIISQYMNRNQMALEDITDSIRKLSAASSTNKQVSAALNQFATGSPYSSENIDRIRSVEEALTFYRNIFFDYRLHYIIMGADESVYSVVDGIDNSQYFGRLFSDSVHSQEWYHSFLEGNEASRWITPCIYTDKGTFVEGEASGEGEPFLLFIRRIRDYNTLRYLGISFVSFPTDNLSQILIPYQGATLALLNEDSQLIYCDGETDHVPILEAVARNRMNGAMEEKEGYYHYSSAAGQAAEYLISYVNIAGTGWCLVNLMSLGQITRAVDGLYHTISFLMILIACGASCVCIAMYFYINAPLNRLIRKVRQVSIGGTRIAEAEYGGRLGKQVFGIMEAEQEVGRMVDHIEKLSAEAIKQEKIRQNLKYEMLRAQLNPHFLFNTLNVIKWSALVSGAGNIADMITSLGILLENSMNRKEEEVPLKEEIRVVKAWVEIKNWALKDRVQIHVTIPQELLEFKVIKFCLQPLVENAVLHGMEHIEHGEIWICGEQYEDRVCITIQDNGVGIKQEALEKLLKELDVSSRRRHVTGIGLSSIHELMKIKYGAEYGLHIESEEGFGTKVYMVFPYKEGEKNAEGCDC